METHQTKMVLIRMNLSSFQGRSNLCRSTREDQGNERQDKLGHFKFECPNLEKEEEKEKKKSLMATWEDPDLSSSKDEDNLCLMTDITSEDENDEVVNCNNLE
ncbi:hypothetical protein CR513_36781, partial [Mucuna pruriens]